MSRTLSEWMEVALWPGVSSDHRRDEFRRRTRVARPDGFEDAPPRAVMLATVVDDVPRDSVISGNGFARPLVVGSGGLDLTCEECGFAVCERVGTLEHFADLVLQCPSCHVYQRVA